MAKSKKIPPGTTALIAPSADFDDVVRLIDAARNRAVAAVNKELIDLYWNIGEYISRIYDEVKNRPLYVIQDKIGF